MKQILTIIFLTAVLLSACDDSLAIENNPDISNAWLVGDAALGWTDNDGSPLTRPMLRTGENTFEYRGNLTAGFLKINCDIIPDWDGRWYLPEKDTVLNNNMKQPVLFSLKGDGGEKGRKWEITGSGHYNIILNKKNSTIECYKEGEFENESIGDAFTHMWLVVAGINLVIEDKPESRKMYRGTGIPGEWIKPPAIDSMEWEKITTNPDTWVIITVLRSGWYAKFNGEDIPRTVWETPSSPVKSSKWFCPPDDGKEAKEEVKFRYGGDNALAWRIVTGTASPATLNRSVLIFLNPRTGTAKFTDLGPAS